jgi:hypothetical protein
MPPKRASQVPPGGEAALRPSRAKENSLGPTLV